MLRTRHRGDGGLGPVADARGAGEGPDATRPGRPDRLPRGRRAAAQDDPGEPSPTGQAGRRRDDRPDGGRRRDPRRHAWSSRPSTATSATGCPPTIAPLDVRGRSAGPVRRLARLGLPQRRGRQRRWRSTWAAQQIHYQVAGTGTWDDYAMQADRRARPLRRGEPARGPPGRPAQECPARPATDRAPSRKPAPSKAASNAVRRRRLAPATL